MITVILIIIGIVLISLFRSKKKVNKAELKKKELEIEKLEQELGK